MFNFEQQIKDLLIAFDLKEDLIKLESPKDVSMGDFSLPCFNLSKVMKKSPQVIANDLCLKISTSDKLVGLNIEKVENVNGYLNFFIKKDIKIKYLINLIKDGTLFKFDNKNEIIMVEYCQVNTHKAFHVGHLRGTLIGSTLINLFRYCGYEVISANYQGDTGAHVAKSLWYLMKYNESFPEKRKGIWLGNIYQKANKLLKDESNKEKYKEEISHVLQKLENRDKDINDLWLKTRKYSLDDFEEIYNLLNVKFDEYFFESQMEEKGKEIVNDLLNNNIAYYDDNAIIIDLKKHNLGIFLLLKSDGTTLYSTKDIALAKIKFDKFKVDKSLYVVGSEQKYYFQQLFKTLEIMGFENAKYCKHIPFDLVNLEGGKISSREGELILALDLIEDVIQKAIDEVKKRSNANDFELTGKEIALSAIKFSMLNYDNNKSIIFDINKSLDFEGETGPYIQYVYARISSILEKANVNNVDSFLNNEFDFSLLNNGIENNIVSKLIEFRSVIENSAENYKVNILCRYLIDLSQLFNEYYHKFPILKEDEEIKNARLMLIICIQKVISEGLKILGIKTLNKM